MRKEFIFCIAGFSLFMLLAFSVNAEDKIPVCDKLGDKVTGEMMKYSVSADVDGAVYFGDIACAMKYRTKEFCAMEMVSFDSSAKVYDYNTGAEVEMGSAYFAVDEKNLTGLIPAFKNKDAADKYAVEHQGVTVLKYDTLMDKEFN